MSVTLVQTAKASRPNRARYLHLAGQIHSRDDPMNNVIRWHQ